MNNYRNINLFTLKNKCTFIKYEKIVKLLLYSLSSDNSDSEVDIEDSVVEPEDQSLQNWRLKGFSFSRLSVAYLRMYSLTRNLNESGFCIMIEAALVLTGSSGLGYVNNWGRNVSKMCDKSKINESYYYHNSMII